MSDKDIIICRCEDITLKDLKDYIAKGYSFEEIKRLLRLGMGPCQGNTCGQLVQRELSKAMKIKLDEVKTPKVRPLTIGVKIKSICEGVKDEG